MFVVHIQFRRDAQSFSLSELPLVVGFFFAPPLTVLLAMVAGTALALTIHRRQSPLKLAFNLANFTVANSVVAVLFMHLVNHHDPLSTLSFLGVLVAVLAGGIVQSLVILTAISFSEGRIDRAGIATTFGFTQAATVVNTCLALDRCPHRLAEPHRAVAARDPDRGRVHRVSLLRRRAREARPGRLPLSVEQGAATHRGCR